MKVVHVINRMDSGGAEKQLRELVSRSRLDHTVLELHSVEGNRRTQLLRNLWARIATERPDVVAAWLERPQLAVAALHTRRLPIVACVRGLPRRSGHIERALVRAALARFDRLVANSQAVRDATTAFARPLRLGPFDVIPNGVDVLSERPHAHSPRDHPLRLGFIGRADPAKGLDVLLAALTALRGEQISAILVGAEVPEAAHGTQLPMEVELLPRVADPWKAVGQLDALVVPSRSEGSPNVVLEAFARGIPVVGTNAGGTAELLACGRGLHVPAGDPHALAEAIRAVAHDPAAAAQRAQAALTYVEKNHSWSRVVAAFETLFEKLGRD
jgi:glycosyltransferase involved in cell wall biosynthesis